MADYAPPVRDIAFTLRTICDLDEIVGLPGFEHVDGDVVDGVLDEAARFFGEVFAPTNEIGDREGAVFVDGTVTVPDAFKDAWAKLVDAGWISVTGSPDFGGHGFPKAIGIAISEMMTSANLAFSLCPMLTGSAITLLTRHGTDELRARYLENLITGTWTGTMVLTEPEAGSDVGAVRTRAERAEDGTYRITGTKIFITWGDHDLVDNIVHLVLARTPDAPPGTKGISLFLVPKVLPDGEGLGALNAIETVSIEHKLGIHASPTCVLSFEGATGWLIGEENAGMGYMFTMMNQARLEVGLEGLAIAERAYQHAASYALDRRQGRASGGTGPSPIIEHPDVRRMLMEMRATTEAMRGIIYDAVASEDRHLHGADEATRRAAGDRLALLTPIAKAWCTDRGCDIASLGIQVFGGMGFVEETGAAIFMRDARIAQIYEGTNGIQAIDLVMRKLPMDGGAVVEAYLDEIAAIDAHLGAHPSMEDLRTELASALSAVRKATEWLNGSDDPRARLAGATPYLDMIGTLAGGYALARGALAAADRAADDPWFAAKVATARYYAVTILPRVHGMAEAVTAGTELLFAIDDELLTTG